MSRPTRAGSAGKPVTIRATDVERSLWQRAADAVGAPSLSDAVRPAITEWAARVVARGNSRETAGRSRRNPRR